MIAETARTALTLFDELDRSTAIATMEPVEATPYLRRLERALGTLFTLGRQHHVPMRQAGLEELFDREDDLRLRLHYPGGRANRAEHYYDENLEAPARSGEPASDATTSQGLLDTDEDKKPTTRDGLITEIENISLRISSQIQRAFEDAKQAIEEPSTPRNPELFEMLGSEFQERGGVGSL